MGSNYSGTFFLVVSVFLLLLIPLSVPLESAVVRKVVRVSSDVIQEQAGPIPPISLCSLHSQASGWQVFTATLAWWQVASIRDFSSNGQELEIPSSLVSIESYEEGFLSVLFTFHSNYCLLHSGHVCLFARANVAKSFYT